MWSDKAEIIKFLLLRDPAGASRQGSRATATVPGDYDVLPLHLACDRYYYDHDKNTILSMVKILFDSYPEAIVANNKNGHTPLDLAIRTFNQTTARYRLNSIRYGAADDPVHAGEDDFAEVVNFLESQMVFACQAQDTRVMTTLDSNGWLPLHHALCNRASLGAIKLLVQANPFALMVADYQLSFPLHIACEHSTSTEIVQYLLEDNGSCLNHCDLKKNSALHYACRGGNCGVVKYFLENQMAIVSEFASERNANNKLPIHLLLEAGDDQEVYRENPKYLETIWRLLQAKPETLLHFDW